MTFSQCLKVSDGHRKETDTSNLFDDSPPICKHKYGDLMKSSEESIDLMKVVKLSRKMSALFMSDKLSITSSAKHNNSPVKVHSKEVLQIDPYKAIEKSKFKRKNSIRSRSKR